LDSLKVLRLGGQQSFLLDADKADSTYLCFRDLDEPLVKPLPAFEDEWGKSARWMNLVAERARQDAENVEKVENGNLGVSHPKWSHDQWPGRREPVFWRPHKRGDEARDGNEGRDQRRGNSRGRGHQARGRGGR